MWSGSTPSWSETSCLYEVTRPVPYSWLPMTSWMRSSLNSIEAVSGKPPPQRSVSVAMPIPRSLSFRSLRARRPGKDDHFRSCHAAVHHLLELTRIEKQFGGRCIGHRRRRHEVDAAN